MEMINSNVSVIIRAKENEPYIGFAIQSVLDFIHNPQIIIIDTGVDNDTKSIIESFPIEYTWVDYLDIYTRYSPGIALNIGVSKSKHDKILILSSHCQITSFPSNNVISPFKFPFFGRQVPIYRGKKITPRYIWSHFDYSPIENMISQIENRPFFHNAFAMYHKSNFKSLKFDESLAGKEDRYWAAKWLEMGNSYYYYPQFCCNHFWTEGGATWRHMG